MKSNTQPNSVHNIFNDCKIFGNIIQSNVSQKMIKPIKSMWLCDFVVIFLYEMSCFSCFFEIFTAALLEIPCFFAKQSYPLISLPDSVFLRAGAFSLFMFLYSRQCGSFRHQFISLSLLIITFVLSAVFSVQSLQTEQAILVSAFTVIIPIYLLCMYSSINKNIKTENIQKV